MNASDPTTPPDVLTTLARSEVASVRRAVAENPNTPLDVLNRLWDKFPAAMLANPIITLWELTEPAALQTNISPRARLASYNYLRKSGADLLPHIHTPESLKKAMEQAFRDENTRVFDQAPSDPSADLRLLFVKAAKSYSSHAEFFYLKAPAKVWQRLARDPHSEVRRCFADFLRSTYRDTETPSPAFIQATRELAMHNDAEVFLHLAHCPLIPADVVQRLALSDSPEIRRALSKCRYTSPESMECLCKDPDESVRLAFATNCQLAQAHELLLKDPSQKVREALASNYHISRRILLQFELVDHPAVLKKVFLNRHAGEELRTCILKEAHPDVRAVVAYEGFRLTPRFYNSHKNLISREVRSLLTKRNGLHPEIAADLATDPHPDIRMNIARRLRGQYCWRDTHANLALLERFATDPEKDIREYVCTDSRLTSKQIEKLARDAEPDIRIEVLDYILGRLEDYRNSKSRGAYAGLYGETRHLFVEAANDPTAPVRSRLSYAKETPPEALGILFEDSDDDIRLKARAHTQWPFGAVLDFEKAHPQLKGKTRHGDTTPSLRVLHEFARSPNPFLRQLTARCSRSCAADLRLLAKDSHPIVREAALARLTKRNKAKIPTE